MLWVRWTTFKIALVLALSVAACEQEKGEPVKAPREEGRRVESSAEGEPVRQGFTHPPPHDAEWLPPPPPPFLSDAERELAAEAELGNVELSEAQSDLLPLVAAFQEGESDALLTQIGELAREHARAGRLAYIEVEKLYEEYLFPNDIDAADHKYKGKLLVMTGRVAPENMTNPADGFKLFRQDPYVHEPLLLETPYETNFVRCHLARAADQKLSDWQTVHLVGTVEGKESGDLVVKRCVVLTALR